MVTGSAGDATARSGEGGKPFVWPEMSVGTWVKALLLRIGLPAVFAAVFWRSSISPHAGDLRPAVEGLALVSVCFAVWWVLHWVYACWRDANAGNERSGPVVTACRAVFALLFLYLVSLFGMVMGGSTLGMASESLGALLGAALGQLLASGLVFAVALLAAVRIASRCFQSWTARREPTEQLWWTDAVGRAALVILHLVAAVGLLVAFCKFTPLMIVMEQSGLFSSDTVTYVALTGSWLQEFASALGQLASSGMLLVVVAALAIRIAFKRFRLWSELKFEQEKQRVEVPRTRFYLLKRALPLLSGIGWVLLILALIAAMLSLVDHSAGMPLMYLSLFLSALFTPSPALPLALVAFVAAQALFGAVEHWNDATANRHGFLNGLTRFLLYAVMAACALLVLYAIVDVQYSYHLFDLVSERMQVSTYVPTVWTFLMQVALRTSYLMFVVIVVLAIICLVIAAFVDGGGGGGGATAGGGGGGAYAGSSFGSGGSSSKKQTVNDRYGRKLLSIEDEGILGTTVRDRYGNKVGDAHEGILGTQHVRIGDDTYEVTDGILGTKNVSKDGRTIGYIDEDSKFRHN